MMVALIPVDRATLGRRSFEEGKQKEEREK